MTFKEFDELFDGLFKECCHMRDTKGQEYANPGVDLSKADRLDNFKRIADQLGIITIGQVSDVLDCYPSLTQHDRELILSRLKPNALAVWGVYWFKHVLSVCHYIKSGFKTKSNESIRGRFVDLTTYNGLGLGLELERQLDPSFMPREGFFWCVDCNTELAEGWYGHSCPQCGHTNLKGDSDANNGGKI